ncbi:hypothetical protein NFI96_005956 [Prochilodus magdalenae]|nr:hypothetical protein NFI96_005956 [Prochilodus magdalenae]
MASISVDHDQFRCPVCLDLLKDPVMVPCGHNFCMVCIYTCWDQEDQRGVYSCPQCRHTFTPRRVLRRNNMLAEVVEKLTKVEFQSASPAPRYAGPGDVQCDFCTGRKLKAIKSCLTCLVSFCETHLKPHYEVPGLKKHKLVEASSQLQEKICSQHGKPIELYCRTDRSCICYLCMMKEHRGHDTVLVGTDRAEFEGALPEEYTRLRRIISPKMPEGLMHSTKTFKRYHDTDIRKVLLDTLTKLGQEELTVFQWHLTNGGEGFSGIPKVLLENADRFETVDKMMERYGHRRVLVITRIILKKMNQHQLSEELRTKTEHVKEVHVSILPYFEAEPEVFFPLEPKSRVDPQPYKKADLRGILLDTVNELRQEDQKVFQWHLTNGVKGFPRIPNALLENRFDTVDQMIRRYGHNGAVEVTLAILKMMNQHHLSDKLRAKIKHVKEVPASWSYSDTKPASPQPDDKHPYKVADIKKVLLDTIDELTQSDLKRFQWHLSNHVEGFSRIPWGLLENADRLKTVDQMTERYGHSGAVEITLAILKKMNQNYLSEELRTKIQQVVPAFWSYSDRKSASTQRDDKQPHNMSNVKEVLLDTIDELTQTELERFHFYLTYGVKGFPGIREQALENADRPETVDEMVQKYGNSGAVEVTLAILEMMKQHLLSKELRTKIEQAKEVAVDDDGDSELASLQSDTKDLSLIDVEPFNPEVVGNRQGFTTTYRFLCPHAGHFRCIVTNLVFEMEGEGEVLYKIDSWDIPKLDGLGQMKPGGPLYNVECFEGSISHLHFPHCEILYGIPNSYSERKRACIFSFLINTPDYQNYCNDENKVKLAVAHFIKDNVEIIPPLQVTSTHVIIHIQGLSPLGIIREIRDLLFNPPISAQVLLFYKRGHSILNIHLLPGTVPVEEVQKKNQHNKYIQTSSKCQLTHGRKYKPSCDPYEFQPEDETFEWDFGPNYHPTFEVFLDSSSENVTIGLLDEYERKVWNPRRVVLKANSTDAASLGTDEEAAEFVDGHRETLIQRVSSVMEIVDRLRSKKMMGKEMYDEIRSEKTSQERMRKLYDALDSGGTKVKAEFYKVLKEKLQSLVDELEAGTSRT